MKKTLAIFIIAYAVYGICVWYYLFHFTSTGIPLEYVGTAADPATFMSADQLQMSTTFARIRHLLFFLSTPFEWLAILFFIFSGLSDHFEDVVKTRISARWLQTVVYYLMFALFSFLVMLPFRFISYQLARFYGTSVMSLSHWLRNRGIDFIVDFILMIAIIQTVLFLMRNFRRTWWRAAWFVFIPFAFFIMLIQPILIDPLYNDFRPIQNPQLETRILNMAEDAGISARSVFEVKMSDRTNTINGYVTGVGPTARIVLWDTATMQLSEDEIMFLMAHEIAHYVNRDVYIGIFIAIVFAFGGMYIVYRVVDNMEDQRLNRIPAAILTVSMLLFAVSPVSNFISRRIEVRADEFALETTQDADAGISLFQTLSATSLNEVHPPRLVRIFRSMHPSIFERIVVLMEE